MTVSVEIAFRQVLLGSTSVVQILGDRIAAHAQSQRTTSPYAVYTRITGIPEHHLLAASGLVFVRMQLDLYGKSFPQLMQLAEVIRMRTDGYSGLVDVDGETLTIQNIELVDSQSGYESANDGSDAGPHRYRMDFRISAPEQIPSLM